MPANNRLNVSAFMERVRSITAASFDATRQEADDALKESISEAYPPASSPGNPPHRRTGALVEGVQSIVIEDADGVEMQQGSSRDGGDPNVPQYLEEGTSKMEPRPFVKPIADEFGPKFRDNAAAAMREEFSK